MRRARDAIGSHYSAFLLYPHGHRTTLPVRQFGVAEEEDLRAGGKLVRDRNRELRRHGQRVGAHVKLERSGASEEV